MNNGLWSGSYRIQNALVIQHDGIPKVLCAFFMTDRKDYWNPKQKRWEGEAIGGPHLRLQHGAPACQPVADAGCPRR